MSKFLVGMLFIFLTTLSLYAEQLNMKHGMWEWTSAMEMQGMAFSVAPVKTTSCVKDSKDYIPNSNRDDGCKMVYTKIKRDSVEWRAECVNDGTKSLSSGKIFYKGTTAHGKIKVTTQGMEMISKVKGRYVGRCK